MAKTAAERATEFLAGVVAHIPEDRRQAALDALTSAPEALNALGQGVLRQDEFSRHKDQLTTQQSELNTLIERNRSWYAENLPKVERANQILEAGGAPLINDDDVPLVPARNPAMPQQPPPNYLTPEQMREQVVQSEKGAVKFFGVLDELRARHFNEFGEMLNTAPLLDDPRLTQIGLPALYQETYAEKYQAKAKATLDKQLADARAEGEKAATERLQAAMSAGPYPTPHAMAAVQPSAVVATLREIHQQTDGDAAKLGQRGFKNRFDEHAAGQEYQQLVAAGVGQGGAAG